MIDWYEQFDEVNAELSEMAARAAEEGNLAAFGHPKIAQAKKLWIGSGEDVSPELMQ